MNPNRTIHSARVPSFVQLGRLHAPTTAAAALAERGLDHTLCLTPIHVETALGNFAAIPGKKAICKEIDRGLSSVPLGPIVSSSYHLTQNRELSEVIDRLVIDGSVVAAGGQGASIWFCCLLGDNVIAGDIVEDYLLFSDLRDGSHGFRASYLPVREVCKNGLATGLPGGWSVVLNHTSQLIREAEAILNITKRLVDLQEVGRQQLARLATVPVEDRLAELLAAIYKEPKKPVPAHPLDCVRAADELWIRDSERVREHRAGVVTCYERLNDEFPRNAGSAWHLYNAVAEFEQHERSGRSPRSIARASLFGDRAETLARAWRVLTAD